MRLFTKVSETQQEERRFNSTCTAKQLVRFSLSVVGIRLSERIPENTVVIPASRIRRNCHFVLGADKSLLEPLAKIPVSNLSKVEGQSDEMAMTIDTLQLGCYPSNLVHTAYWISRRGNELIAHRNGNESFAISLTDKTSGKCRFREILESSGVTFLPKLIAELPLKDVYSFIRHRPR